MMDGLRFDYMLEVPAGGHSVLPWPARLREPPASTKAAPVGPTPTVTLENFDERPGVARTRVRFMATARHEAEFAEISFVVDRGFAAMLKPADTFYAATNYDGAFGVSVLRQGLLIAAAGAVSSVPLGESVKVSYPGAMAREAERVFRAHDPRFRIRHVPVLVETETQSRLLTWGRPTLDRYEIFVVHPFDGYTECLAITLPKVCPDCAATLTAPVINRYGSIRYVRWENPGFERDAKVLFAMESARVHLEEGNLDAAYESAIEAMIYHWDNEEVARLLEEIERKRR